MDEVEGVDCSPCCVSDCRRTILNLFLGQVLSLSLCGTAITSEYLSKKFQVNTPTTQSFISYFFLCLIYGTILSCRPPERGMVRVIRERWWKYLILAILDVEANFLVVTAYQYTSLTSVVMLNCFAVPVVLVLSWLCLSVRYLMSHIIGVCICLIGIGCLVYADTVVGRGTLGGSDKLVGDLLCLLAATFYGFSNVGEEFFVKNFSRIEYLGMVGLFGSIISGIQLAILERASLAQVRWSDYRILLLYFGFAVCMFVFYSLVSVVMHRTSATMFNLSVLTVNFYSLFAGIFLFQYKFHVLYLVSFVVILLGSVVYAVRETQRREGRSRCSCCCSSPSSSPFDDLQTQSLREPVRPSPRELDSEGVAVKFCPVHGTVVLQTDNNPSTSNTPRRDKGPTTPVARRHLIPTSSRN